MNISIRKSAEELGISAAAQVAEQIQKIIETQGYARMILSTGASQFTFLQALSGIPLDWSKVEMFHLDEYVDLSESHPASFRRYLKERFVSYAEGVKAHWVNGEGDIHTNISELTAEIRKAPIDIALIGIGENAHIAFNDPPANFNDPQAYKVVDLDEACKAQQVNEGWFESLDAVPKQAITMTVSQIMQSKMIISCVPHKVKSTAVKNALNGDVSELCPASILKTHGDWWLYLDEGSSSEITGISLPAGN